MIELCYRAIFILIDGEIVCYSDFYLSCQRLRDIFLKRRMSMDWNKDWWRYGLVALVVVGLLWWRNRQQPEAPVAPMSEQEATERANKFLQEAGIEVPEGTERANLMDLVNEGLTGVVTRKVEGGKTEISVIAGLPETTKLYVAWLANDQGDWRRLGRLVDEKGGMKLDYQGEGIGGFDEVVVSEETGVGVKPTKPVLRGYFNR